MKIILILAALAISSFAATSHFDELGALWSTWKSIHDKSYTPEEDAARYAIFVDNYEKVIKHNAKGTTYTLGLNLFADLTAAEFKQKYTGCAHYEDDEEFVKENTISFEVEGEMPGDVDWRNNGVVTGVKNQGQCGSCWTFSTTGLLEGFYAINNHQLLSFSEQQIVDCAKSAGQGCSGGYPYLAVQYAAQNGLEQEGQYPYTAQNGNCQFNGGEAVHTNNGYGFVANYNSDALKSALNSMPISVLIEADQDVFQMYTGGILVAQSGCGASLDHAVLAVGYATYSTNIGNVEAFIVKNSWGDGWGTGGYVFMATDGSANGGAGVCGILSQPVAAT